MNRRDVITVLGGAAAVPFAARAQPESVRRVGVPMNLAADEAYNLAHPKLGGNHENHLIDCRGKPALGWR
jgi:hypothetical protein